MVELVPIVLSMLAAAGYSVLFYGKTRQGDGDEPFSGCKFGATLIVGAGVGLAFGLTDTTLTESRLETQLAAYAGAVAVVETGLKIVVRQIRGRI